MDKRYLYYLGFCCYLGQGSKCSRKKSLPPDAKPTSTRTALFAPPHQIDRIQIFVKFKALVHKYRVLGFKSTLKAFKIALTLSLQWGWCKSWFGYLIRPNAASKLQAQWLAICLLVIRALYAFIQEPSRQYNGSVLHIHGRIARMP